jgi:hypothetical protein
VGAQSTEAFRKFAVPEFTKSGFGIEGKKELKDENPISR